MLSTATVPEKSLSHRKATQKYYSGLIISGVMSDRLRATKPVLRQKILRPMRELATEGSRLNLWRIAGADVARRRSG